MNGTGYKILGFLVWQGGKWYVRRTYGRYIPSRRTAGAIAAGAAVAIAAAVVLTGRRDDT